MVMLHADFRGDYIILLVEEGRGKINLAKKFF